MRLEEYLREWPDKRRRKQLQEVAVMVLALEVEMAILIVCQGMHGVGVAGKRMQKILGRSCHEEQHRQKDDNCAIYNPLQQV